MQLKDDPILGVLYVTAGSLPSARLNRSFRFPVWAILTVIAAAFAGWVAWPYYTAYGLVVATRTGDVSFLENHVAWNSVREGLRNDLNAAFLQKLAADTNISSGKPGAALGAGFAAVLGPAIVDRMVNAYVTPQVVANLNRKSNADIAAAEPAVPAASNISEAIKSARNIRWNEIKYAFFAGGPFTFRIDFLPETNAPSQHTISLLFKWNGSWKLTRILLPVGEIGGLSTAAKSEGDTGSPVLDVPPAAASSTSPASKGTTQKQPPPVNITLISKSFKSRNIQAHDFQDAIIMKLAITNLTDKDIRAFDGVLTFTDLLDNEILSTKLAINDPVKAGKTMNWVGSINYNEFIESHQGLRNAQQENLKIRFAPRKVLFVDGSTKEYVSR